MKNERLFFFQEKRPIVEKGIKKLSLMESKKIIAISSSEQRNDYRAYH